AAKTILTDQLGRRGVLAGGDNTGGDSGSVDSEGGLPAEGGGRMAQALTGEILTRDDVVKAIDKICEYYARHEPSSPLPLLLKRAKRLSTMSFMEILQDLVPDGVPQAQLFGGTTSEE
ncbi:MAG: type VI secretion system protein TssA, partial [Planctomycetota bacterium]|nr:type VI secretion system protein TssA [Planctomycetota bacterium]